MTQKRHGQPRKRGERKEEAQEVETQEVQVEAPKEEKSKLLDFAAPDGGFDVARPDGYEFGKHRMLKKEEFKEEAVFFEFRAAGFRERAAALEQAAVKFDVRAADARRLGSSEDRKRVTQLRSLQTKERKLREELAANGIDADMALGEG